MNDREVRLILSVLSIPYAGWNNYIVGKTVYQENGETMYHIHDVKRYIVQHKPVFYAQKYLFIPHNADPFTMPFFDRENHFVGGVTVIDQVNFKFTQNGTDWEDIHQDHL